MARTAIPKEGVKLYCLRCGSSNQAEFYQTKDPNRKFYNKIPYCKKCVKEMLVGYQKKYKENVNLAFYYLCRKIDIPYIHTNFTGALENIKNPDSKIFGEENLVPAYMKGFAFAEQNGWGCSFDESQGENEIDGLNSYEEHTKVRKKNSISSNNLDDYNIVEYDTEFLQNKWGMFTNEELAYVESEYLDWEEKLGGQINEKSIELIVKQICLQCLDIYIARQQGSDVGKKVTVLRGLLSDGGLVEKQSNTKTEKYTVGQKIADIERMRPVYKPDEALTDVDNINKLLVGFVGSTCRALGKTNAYTEEFDRMYKDYTIDIIEDINGEGEVVEVGQQDTD